MSPELGVPSGMRSFRFPAMGTEVHVLLPLRHADSIAALRAHFECWEARLSRFRPESDLSQLNARAGEAVVVHPVLFEVVRAAVDAARATDGAFDPTLLHQLVRVGYAAAFPHLRPPPRPATSSVAPGGDWREISLDPTRRTIAIPSGCALDLGGIAKGMAVDAVLDLLGERGVESALVSAGGDLAVLGLPPASEAWHVLVGVHGGGVVPLVRGALATSGSTRRFWNQDGIERHHLIDPSTGEPARSGLREVTVAAGSCRVAEVAATASFVVGEPAGTELLHRHRLAGILTRDDGSTTLVGSWPSAPASAA